MNYTMNSLDVILDSMKVSGKGVDFTHTSVTGGKYYIEPDRFVEFMTAYSNTIQAGLKPLPSLTERHREVSPFLIDFDLHQVGPQRIYTSETLHNVTTIILQEAARYIAPEFMKDAVCYIFEKPEVRLDKDGVSYKDGVHIIIPHLVTTPDIQYWVRTASMPLLAPLFSGYTNQIDDIYDKAVIKRNGWMMLGSVKPGGAHPYAVTHVGFTGSANFDPSAMEAYSQLSVHEQVELFSIRNKWDECKLTELAYFAQEQAEDAKFQKTLVAVKGGEPRLPNLSQIKSLVNILSVDRASSRTPWLELGWLLHNLDQSSEMCEVWDAFSQNCMAKYEEGGCAERWEDMHVNEAGLKMGSLVMWAKQDSPTLFREFVGKNPGFFGEPKNPESSKNAFDTTRLMLALSEVPGLQNIDLASVEVGADKVAFSTLDNRAGEFRWLDSEIKIEGKFVRYLDPIHYQYKSMTFATVHSCIPSSIPDFTHTWISEQEALITCSKPGISIKWNAPFSKNSCVDIVVPGEKYRVQAKKKMMIMEENYHEARKLNLQFKYGVPSIFINNAVVNVIASPTSDEPTPYDQLRCQLVAAAVEGSLRKLNGWILKPIEGCPCAYVADEIYDDFINRVVGDDPLLNSNIHRFEELQKYLKLCNNKAFPNIRMERDLLSFRNGVLHTDAPWNSCLIRAHLRKMCGP